jgi:biotin operon repressor
MSLLKYIERLKRMDDLIRRKATGCAEEFAAKLHISKSQLFQDLKEMKELGAQVEYCSIRKSYYYISDCRLVINFIAEGQRIKGGKNSLDFFNHSSIAGVRDFTLAL